MLLMQVILHILFALIYEAHITLNVLSRKHGLKIVKTHKHSGITALLAHGLSHKFKMNV